MSLRRALLLVFAQMLLVFVLGWGVIGPAVLGDVDDPFAPRPGLFVLLAAVAGMGALGLVWLGSVRLAGRTWRELGWHADSLAWHIARGLFGGLALVGLMLGFHLALGASLEELWDSLTSPSLGQRTVFLAIGVQAAFIEESLFRGNLLPALQARLPASLALVLHALIFAVYHLNFRLPSLLFKTLLGCSFGALRGRDGSLVAPAIAHALTWVLAGTM